MIFAGFCAEYSYGANRIQENYKTVCSSFLQNPCPTGYNSTQAYRCKNKLYFFILVTWVTSFFLLLWSIFHYKVIGLISFHLEYHHLRLFYEWIDHHESTNYAPIEYFCIIDHVYRIWLIGLKFLFLKCSIFYFFHLKYLAYFQCFHVDKYCVLF